jgi:hypothetical protein
MRLWSAALAPADTNAVGIRLWQWRASAADGLVAPARAARLPAANSANCRNTAAFVESSTSCGPKAGQIGAKCPFLHGQIRSSVSSWYCFPDRQAGAPAGSSARK